ncbi:CKLF-like MARVEL transmembrane domain-containing protein 7 isoform X2 [Mustela erminea]|uniref:CKLF-like MARVEL transmembrane domain-containing protein 7 isoform X2 n=1 Tax=Mustela erminea TaxID=36723 RepID=UPI001386E43C|nr:CKLF-like MARVEL transmembrane domain-containing protein 7 isoform X2 [Mustela erminea]
MTLRSQPGPKQRVVSTLPPRRPPHQPHRHLWPWPTTLHSTGHAADRLHLREELCVVQLQCLQLLPSGHHLQLDNDPHLLSGAPVPPLPLAHVHQLAPVDLWFRGYIPLPGEYLDVLQDLMCDPVNRCSCVTPPQAGPTGGPADRRVSGPAPMKGF